MNRFKFPHKNSTFQTLARVLFFYGGTVSFGNFVVLKIMLIESLFLYIFSAVLRASFELKLGEKKTAK